MQKKTVLSIAISACLVLMLGLSLSVQALSGNNKYTKKPINYTGVVGYYEYTFTGTTRMTGKEVYDIVMPATLAQGNAIAALWNSGKSNQKMYVETYENKDCVFNPDYCASKGINSGSHVIGYGLY